MTDRRRGRYEFPRGDRRKRGRAGERLEFLAQRRGAVPPEVTTESIDQRRRQLTEKMRPPLTGLPVGADADLWVPIGPTTVVQGQASGNPRIAGRVRELRVSDDGTRAYAATANGGVWFSGDSGDTWIPLGGWGASGSPPPLNAPANVLVCGGLYVRFGANAGADEVLVGTGELIPRFRAIPGGRTGGVGILRAVGPSAAAEMAQVWSVEGTNLAGLGIFRLAGDPDQATPTTFVAATTAGLWTRSGGPAATWTLFARGPFNAAGVSFQCTDAIWVKGQGATPTRLWVAVNDTAANSGLYVLDAGAAGAFQKIVLPGLQPKSRISLAAAPSNPSVVYALANGNLVWRLDGLVPTPVTRIPPNLLGGQDSYDQAVAVHPTRPERIVLAGATEQVDGEWSASLYLANVTGPTGGNYQFGFTTAAGGNATTDDSFVGHGVHSDVHVVRFVPVAGKTEIWVGCDGGVFRSQEGDSDNRAVKNSFLARNTGIASLECGYVATHPLVDGYILAGTQDNGTLERIGDTLWRVKFSGDGGGIAFNPAAPHRFVYQYNKADWNDDGTAGFVRPIYRSNSDVTLGTATEQAENTGTAFYAGVDAVLASPGVARLALGTYRIWYSDDWGATWHTFTSMADSMAIGSQNAQTDGIVNTGAGVADTDKGKVVAVRWASTNRLYVLCQRALVKYDLAADAAAPAGLRVTPLTLTRFAPGKCEDPQADVAVANPSQVLPALGVWSDLAVHDPTASPHGSFYVTTTAVTTGKADVPAMDTLWWFDGKDRWHTTNLRNDATHGVKAPAYAVVVDPGNRNHVYVGTAVGVWRGTFNSGGPSWTWEVFCNGLPEASIQDLTVVTVGTKRLLRAAVAARGVWEVDLTASGAAQTFVRVHQYDTRRASPVALTDPTQPAPNTGLVFHASPDIRVIPARGSKPPNPTGLPWSNASSDPYGLWVFQTAIHGKPTPDRLVRPTGQWTPQFQTRLRALTGGVRVTQAIWNAHVGTGASFPNAYADPWDGAAPTEADLFELIQDRAAPVGSPASIGVRPVSVRVHVLVHHRHLTPVAAANVKVTLIRRDVTGTNAAAWSALAGDWTVPVQNFLRNGGATPALPDNWVFADTGTPVQQPSADVDARLPRAATFTVNLTGLGANTRLLLVAIVHSSVDPVTLPNQTLETLARGTRYVAVRSLEIG